MDLSRLYHFERFVPNVGNNHQLPEDEQLTFEVAVGLTKVELQGLQRLVSGDELRKTSDEALAAPRAEMKALRESGATPDVLAAKADELAEAGAVAELDGYARRIAAGLASYVRVGPGRHTVDGKALTLESYLRATFEQPGFFNLSELTRELTRLNSVKGSAELFSAQRSGGSASTGAASSATKPAVH